MTSVHPGQLLLGLFAGAVAAAALAVLIVSDGLAPAVSVIASAGPLLIALAATLIVHRVALMITRPHHRSAGRRTVPETERRRFRVTAVSGGTVDCVLTGQLVGGQLLQGDVVDVFGRLRRDGTVKAAEVVVPARNERVSGRRSVSFLLARSSTAVPAAVAGVCAVGVAYSLLGR